MIKLHTETAQAIGDLINRIDVAVIMRKGANAKDNIDEHFYWKAEEFKAIITLTEDYGIPHLLYDLAVESMKMDMYANATLGRRL